MPRKGTFNTFCYLATLLLALVVGQAASAPVPVPTKPQPASQANDESVQFKQAIAFDLSGQPLLARRIYDQLKTPDLKSLAAVPSAINLAALGKYPESAAAFSAIEKSANLRDKEYAQLWSLWLTSRQWKGTPQALAQHNSQYVKTHNWHLPWEEMIAQLYAGKITEKELMASINKMMFKDANKKDALTEGIFFAEGYLQYIKHDPKQARDLFKQYQFALHSNSLERPLLLKTYALSQ